MHARQWGRQEALLRSLLEAHRIDEPTPAELPSHDDYDGAKKCGYSVGLGKPCFEVPPELVQQATQLVAEFERVFTLLFSAGRVPEMEKVRKMSSRFAHREQAYRNQLKWAAAEPRAVSVAKGSGGRVGSGSAVAAAGASDGGETMKEKLDRVIANGEEIIANGEETNWLLRSLEGMGERLLAAGGVAGGDDSDDDDDEFGDDGGDAEMAG
ncbi:MAG: hypothetical protein M1816_005239 [Peltula sp. TS41687]|nr:MAG: hypothetical protein M1816_005239 [Peltula sp. TS41687]